MATPGFFACVADLENERIRAFGSAAPDPGRLPWVLECVIAHARGLRAVTSAAVELLPKN
jgi:hypothetical protein